MSTSTIVILAVLVAWIIGILISSIVQVALKDEDDSSHITLSSMLWPLWICLILILLPVNLLQRWIEWMQERKDKKKKEEPPFIPLNEGE